MRLAVASLVRSAPAAAAVLARNFGWSERHLRRRFRDALGLGPGRLRRIARFARTWRRVAAAPPGQGWAALPVDAGYSDQAHLIRDFRDLAGDSPARLFGEAWYRTTAFEPARGPMSGSIPPRLLRANQRPMHSDGSLSGRIAVVTGASRGIGLGVAHELGVAGATVYATGRSRAGTRTTDGLPGTIDETARLVTEAGGEGIAVACDHTDDAAVDSLAAAIGERHGAIDLLVNSAWGGYEQYDAALFRMPVHEQPIWRFDRMIASGVRAQYVTPGSYCPCCAAGR